jgi:predicted dithiol-disulfide oxidoreductase (DUF899 family)
LLAKEKKLTEEYDAIAAARRQLPGVKVGNEYEFVSVTDSSKASLGDLFEGRRQLVVHHVMFDPSWDAACSACSFGVDDIGNLSHLHSRNTTLALVSRAPVEKIAAFKKRMGWSKDIPWYSSLGSDFNYDFHVTMDEHKVPLSYNYVPGEVMKKEPRFNHRLKGEQSGYSVFYKTDNGDILHTYGTFARGIERVVGTYGYLDITPLGRGLEGCDIAKFDYHDQY